MPHRRSSATLGLLTIGVTAFWLLLIVYALRAIQPAAPYTLPFERELKPLFRATLTQGWGFFSRSPRDEAFGIYQPIGTSWESVYRGPSSEPRNSIGFNRFARAQGVEFGLLTAGIGERSWLTCETTPSTCLGQYESPVAIKNISPAPIFCGKLGAVLQEPLPWAWAKSKDSTEMSARVLVLDVSCT